MHKYPYFFRVVPSDKFQVQAMLDLLIHFRWTYVSAVISRGDYGELALKTLEELVDNVTAPGNKMYLIRKYNLCSNMLIYLDAF